MKSNETIPQKRLTKEIELIKALPPTNKVKINKNILGTEIEVTIPRLDNKFNKLIYSKDFVFNIFLHERFPFEQPQFFMAPNILFPLIDNKCDLTKDILSIEWKPMLTMSDIVANIPEFLAKVIENRETQDEELIIFGRYLLQSSYLLSSFSNDQNCCVFASHLPSGSIFKTNSEIYVIVTNTSLLIFNPIIKGNDEIRLINWIPIPTILNIVIVHKSRIRIEYISTKNSGTSIEIINDNIKSLIEIIRMKSSRLGIDTSPKIESEKDKLIYSLQEKFVELENIYAQNNKEEIKKEILKILDDLINIEGEKGIKYEFLIKKIKFYNSF